MVFIDDRGNKNKQNSNQFRWMSSCSSSSGYPMCRCFSESMSSVESVTSTTLDGSLAWRRQMIFISFLSYLRAPNSNLWLMWMRACVSVSVCEEKQIPTHSETVFFGRNPNGNETQWTNYITLICVIFGSCSVAFKHIFIQRLRCMNDWMYMYMFVYAIYVTYICHKNEF